MITLDQGFDSGSIDLRRARVRGGSPPLIVLEPRRSFDGKWWWCHVRLSGIRSQAPVLSLPIEGCYSSALQAEQRLVWSADGELWQPFDHARHADGRWLHWNERPFDHHRVFVALNAPYPWARVEQRVEAWLDHPAVSPTPSALRTGDAAGVAAFASTRGSELGGYRDDCGRRVPSLPLLGLRISEHPEAERAPAILLVGGNHCGEHCASWCLEGSVEALLADDDEMRALRRSCCITVYPLVDPEGRQAGCYRSTPADPDRDHNRIWSDDDALTVRSVRAAIARDLPRNLFAALDYHGHGSADSFLYLDQASGDSALVAALRRLEPELPLRFQPCSDGGLRPWLQARFPGALVLTPEASMRGDLWLPPRLLALGRSYAQAMAAAVCGALAPA